MSSGHVKVGVGTRFIYDGQILTVEKMTPTAYGVEVVAVGGGYTHLLSLKMLLDETRSRVIPSLEDTNWIDEEAETAALLLAQLSEAERHAVRERATHVREVLTGFRSGSEELKQPDEPRPQFDPRLPLGDRYSAKAAELGLTRRTVERWGADYQRFGEAGLASSRFVPQMDVDERWLAELMSAMTAAVDQSRPTRSALIRAAFRQCEERYGRGVVPIPPKSTAYRAFTKLNTKIPLYPLSTKRNRDIAGRANQPYGRLQATRPGEYVYLDTTRLDVYAMDPATLRWVNLELTVALDAYSRCVIAFCLTPVSTKAVDAATVLYRCYRPRPAGKTWPDYAVWPEHGIPRCVLIDHEAIEREGSLASGPATVPETIVVDHGKIYVSEHLTSVCARLGISIQPARVRQPTDKAPVERFFRTLRESLLQYLPGYKGPDLYSRGLNAESHAFYYLDELDDIIGEWIATVYHHRPHDGLVEPTLPSARMSPAMMYEHGLARSGYVEVPSDPDLAYEFLQVVPRTIQHYGVEVGKRRYSGASLTKLSQLHSPYSGRFRNKWPVYVDPDDIRYVYIRDPEDRSWHTLEWEHAKALAAPLSDEALRHMRRQAARIYEFVDDLLVLDELLARWQVTAKSSATERRLALRLARQDAQLSGKTQLSDAEQVAQLPSVAAVSPPTDDTVDDTDINDAADDGDAAAVGDDDIDEELDADYGRDSEDYYGNSWEDA